MWHPVSGCKAENVLHLSLPNIGTICGTHLLDNCSTDDEHDNMCVDGSKRDVFATLLESACDMRQYPHD